jgi:hypothetical protein
MMGSCVDVQWSCDPDNGQRNGFWIYLVVASAVGVVGDMVMVTVRSR